MRTSLRSSLVASEWEHVSSAVAFSNHHAPARSHRLVRAHLSNVLFVVSEVLGARPDGGIRTMSSGTSLSAASEFVARAQSILCNASRNDLKVGLAVWVTSADLKQGSLGVFAEPVETARTVAVARVELAAVRL
jgi:hypothetical protein